MTRAQTLSREFAQEAATTRRVLERIPEDRLDWRPHPKSWTVLELATHLANLPTWSHAILDQDSFDIDPPGGADWERPDPHSRDDVLELFDRNVSAATEALAASDDETFASMWSFQKHGRELFKTPKEAATRSFVLRHWCHHRGQMTVYLRLLEVPVPQVYGPTADEPEFG